MKISEIITDKYKLRIPPTVYYELLADVQEVEEEQEPFKPMVEIDLYSVIKQKYIEREVLDKIRAEIEELRYGQPFRKFVVDECLEILDKYKADKE